MILFSLLICYGSLKNTPIGTDVLKYSDTYGPPTFEGRPEVGP